MVSLQTAVLTLAMAGAGGSGGETVLLDFCADWCVPCRQMGPAVEQLAVSGYPVRKVNFDRNRALAAEYGVESLPTFVMLVDGRAVDRVVGCTSFSKLEQMCRLALAGRSRQQAASSLASTPGKSPPISIPPAENAPPFPGATQQAAGGSFDLPLPSGGWAPAGRPAGPGWTLRSGDPNPLDANLIAATVRLRIEDRDGHSCGSGTIIDARAGEALILTCGHIFRDSQGKGRITVDLFGPNPAEGIPGSLIRYDLERDIGLLSIRVPGPVATARVAPPGYRISKDVPVVNVGCNHGAEPTARHARVISLNRFTGPPNLQVSGLPVQGRSGGGLFSGDGLVLGVCNAADPADNEGFYAAMESIHAALDEVKLAYVYRSGTEGPAAEVSLVAVEPPPMPKRMPRPEGLVEVTQAPSAWSPTRTMSAPAPADRRQPLSADEQAALEEIRRRKLNGAEVICIIRSLADPRAPSEVIVLDKVSPAFLEQLVGRGGQNPPRELTSMAVPHGRRPTGDSPAPTAGYGPPRAGLQGEPRVQPFSAANSNRPAWQPQWQGPEAERR